MPMCTIMFLFSSSAVKCCAVVDYLYQNCKQLEIFPNSLTLYQIVWQYSFNVLTIQEHSLEHSLKVSSTVFYLASMAAKLKGTVKCDPCYITCSSIVNEQTNFKLIIACTTMYTSCTQFAKCNLSCMHERIINDTTPQITMCCHLLIHCLCVWCNFS